MNFSARFKSLPTPTKRLLGLGIVLALVVALPLFVWAIVTQRFNLGKKAASGEPVPSPTPIGNSITWNTDRIHLSATNFYINIDGNKLFVDNNPTLQLHSDPGTSTYTTLEATWTENNVGMSLFMYFSRNPSTNRWQVTEIRTSNGNPSSDWLYYPGFDATDAGSTYYLGNANYFSNDGRGLIHFENLNIQTFFAGLPTPIPTTTPTPLTCAGNPFTFEISPSYQQSNPGGTLRYSVLVTNNNNPRCESILANLIVDKPSNWTADFGTQSFSIPGNTTYSTYLDVTSPTSNYILGAQPISIRISTIYGTTNSQTVTYDLVNKPLYQILKFLFKFSGITDGGADGGNVAVRFVKPNFFDFFVSPVKVNYIGNGVYSATVAFASTMTPGLPVGNDYTIYLKGEKHLARKFCYQSGQTTRCTANGYISIGVTDTQTEQVFDFTGLPLEPGDVYPQDGAADLNDFAKIKSLLSKLSSDLTSQDKLIGDLDYNGIINVKDLFLMRKTLESKYDEN